MRAFAWLKAALCCVLLHAIDAHAEDRPIEITGFTCTGWGAKNCKATRVPGHLLVEPNAPAKAPLLILVHTSAGISKDFLEEAVGFAQQGYAVLYLDHFGPRKILMSHYDYAGATAVGANVRTMSMDVLAALAFLQSDPRVDVDKAIIVGFSQGGLTGHWLSSATFIDAHKSLLPRLIMPKAVAALYSCPIEFTEASKSNGLPYFMIVGDKDGEYAHCQLYDQLNRAKGLTNVSIITLPGVYHTFDAEYQVQSFQSAENVDRCFAIIHRDGSATNPILKKEYAKYTYDQGAKDCIARGQMAGNNGNRWIGAQRVSEIIKQFTK